MFFRRKFSGRTEYLQAVKNDRVDGRPRQSVVASPPSAASTSWRKTAPSNGCWARERGARSAVVLTAYEKGEATAIATRQLGPALAFERLWRETGFKQVISALAAERDFQFDLERTVFWTVLHRLFEPGSDPGRGEVAPWPGYRQGRPASGCTSCTGRWVGSVMNWTTRAGAALAPAPPRISSRSDCSPCATAGRGS
jgi:hypothetical protein